MKSEFKKIGLWGCLAETRVAKPVLTIASHLRDQGIEVACPSQDQIPKKLKDIPTYGEDDLPLKVDLIMAIGGDGTLLRAARSVAKRGIPLLGINLGRLGFLTDVSPEKMLDTIDAILSGNFVAEDRLMLEADICSRDKTGNSMIALNDVVLEKGTAGHMQDFVTRIDGEYVNTHGGDGLIVATPTGSTAYALSCGGPIIQPDTNALVIVPICPHTLSDRPLVLNASSYIEVQIDSQTNRRAYATCDGQLLGEISGDDTIRIRLAKETVQLLHPRDHNYYELLRSRLNWGQTNRWPRSQKKR